MAEEKAAPVTPAPATPAPAEAAPQMKQGDTKTVETIGQSTVTKTPPPPQGNPLMDMLPMLIGMMIIFYLLMIRPENKRRKEQQEMLSAMKKGDKVLLAASGILGLVKDIDGEEVTVLIDAKKDVNVKVRKEFVSIVNPEKKDK